MESQTLHPLFSSNIWPSNIYTSIDQEFSYEVEYEVIFWTLEFVLE